MKKNSWAISLLIITISGCYQYNAPSPSITGRIYSPGDYAKSQQIMEQNPILTLAHATKIALINNPTLISAMHSANAAKFNYYGAIGAYAPEINLGASVQNQPNKYGKLLHPIPDASKHERHFLFETSAEMSWLIFDGLAREFKMLAAEKHAQGREELTRDATRKLTYAVAVAYYDVLISAEAEQIYLSDMIFQNTNLDFSLKQQQAGYSDLAQVLNFRILKARAASNLRNAQRQRQVSMLSLAMLLGYPDGKLPLDMQFPGLPGRVVNYPHSLESCLDMAINRRPDYRAGIAAMQALKYMKYTRISAYSPIIRFVAGAAYRTDHGRYDAPGLPTDSYLYGGVFHYGFEGSWKLFDGFTRYNAVREYEALYAASDFDMAQMYLQIINEVRSAYADYENNLDQCLIYHETLEWTATQRRLVESEYTSGRVIVTRLNEAQNDLVRARYEYMISVMNLYKSVARLNMAIGETP